VSAVVSYRRAGEADHKFCLYSWVKALKFEYSAGLIAVDDWREVMTPQLDRILHRPGVEMFVAYRPGETVADLYGWIAVERGHAQPLVHFVYVKTHQRGEGFARGLFRAAGIDPRAPFTYTTQTAPARSAQKLRKIPGAKWNPMISRHPKTNPKPRGDHGRS